MQHGVAEGFELLHCFLGEKLPRGSCLQLVVGELDPYLLELFLAAVEVGVEEGLGPVGWVALPLELLEGKGSSFDLLHDNPVREGVDPINTPSNGEIELLHGVGPDNTDLTLVVCGPPGLDSQMPLLAHESPRTGHVSRTQAP